MTITQILMVLVTAILAFAGARRGAIIGQRPQANTKGQELDLNFRREILKHRTALIERFALGIGKLRRASVIQNIIENEAMPLNADVIRWAAKENGGKLPEDYTVKIKPDFKHLVSLNQEQLDIHGEFMAILNLGKVYFGKKTSEAIDRLAQVSPIHAADEDRLRDVLAAMAAELYDFSQCA